MIEIMDVMTCCNIYMISIRGHEKAVFLSDIATGKPVYFYSAGITPDALWHRFYDILTDFSFRSKHKNSFPGAAAFIGDKKCDKDGAIIYDWTNDPPVIVSMSSSLYASKLQIDNNSYKFVDLLSSKKLEFMNLDGGNCSKQKFDAFLDDHDTINDVVNSKDHILFGVDQVSCDDKTVYLDADTLCMFSTYKHLYYLIYNDLKKNSNILL